VLVETPVPIGWWRSVYASQNAFATECFLDEVAAAMRRDPVELRRALLAKSPRHRAVLELAASKSGWGSPPSEGRARGVALCESFGSHVAQVAEVSRGPGGEPRVHRVTCAVDCGMTVNPGIIRQQIEGAVGFALTPVLHGPITIAKGRVEQSNFDDHPLVTMREMPEVDVHIVPSRANPGGIGEPGVPPLAPAVANAFFALTRRRVRKLPIRPEDLAGG
jgi:isoquinoline 1-oxidoreductase beta subunit